MEKIETLEEFYKKKFDWMPDNIKNEIGHFNVFRLEPFAGDKPQQINTASSEITVRGERYSAGCAKLINR
jgi:hypothetical protein